MRNFVYFLLTAFILTSGCKKEVPSTDACLGVVCYHGGTCVNGVCVCDSLHTGTDCSEWIVPVQKFPGNYHLVGTTTVYNSGQPPVITPVDDTLTLTQLNDSTLVFKGFQLQYAVSQPDSFYAYAHYAPYSSVFLRFHKPFADDSVFYDSNDSSPFGTGATIIQLRGVKIQ